MPAFSIIKNFNIFKKHFVWFLISFCELKGSDSLICMSRKGEYHDNAVAESFFHTLKEELVYDEDFATKLEARQAIFKYIEFFYNRKRRHSYIGYKAPFVYEAMSAAA